MDSVRKQSPLPRLCMAAVGLTLLIHYLPFLLNMKYLLAATHGDDGLLAYDAVLRFPERFRGDLMSLVVNSYFKGSLMNYGSVFLNRAAGIPLILLCCIYVFWMRFAMPLFFTTVLRSRLSIEERSVVFFVSLLAGIEAWNLANYGAHNEMPIPYAGAVAFPFFMGGLYLFSNGRKTGILPLLFGALIHPSMGLYTAVTLGLYFLFSPGPGKLKILIWPFIVALTAAAPSLILLSARYPAVPVQEYFESAIRLNIHATPWGYPFRWPQVWPTVIAFVLLAASAFRHWKDLGENYFRLILASIMMAAFFSLLQLAGHWMMVPKLVLLLGLRSLIFPVSLLFPVIMLYLFEQIKSQNAANRFLGFFIAIQMVAGAPYGLDKIPVLLLWGLSGAEKLTSLPERGRKFLLAAIKIAGILWIAAWCLGLSLPSLLLDPGPSLNALERLTVLAAAIFFTVLPLLRKKQDSEASGRAALMALLLFLYTASSSYFMYDRLQTGPERSLYDAQVWARENTPEDSRFLIHDASWRSFSERPAFVTRPMRYHIYSGDERIKRFDDLVYKIYGMNEDYKKHSFREIHFAMEYIYSRFSEKEFLTIGQLTGSDYLLESRDLGLPLAYENSHYKIYKIS